MHREPTENCFLKLEGFDFSISVVTLKDNTCVFLECVSAGLSGKKAAFRLINVFIILEE